jgi:DNA polymerase I-like protein with 3'-5' exonuclease and polymerase domains
MNKVGFLAYVPDPFGVQPSVYCIYTPPNTYQFIAESELSKVRDTLVTYEIPALIDDLRRYGTPPPPSLIDISEALRLLAAIPKDEGNQARSDIWKNLAPHFSHSADATAFHDIVLSRSSRPDAATVTRLTKVAASALFSLWSMTSERLVEAQEKERFDRVEAPLHSVFAERQFRGIAIDNKVAIDSLRKLADEKYRGYATVASLLKRSPTDLHFWNIREFLESTDAAHLALAGDGGKLRDAFKLALNSEFARSFLMFSDASRDEDILKRLLGDADRVHPVFQTFGTVTGRVMVSDPYLQNLRRQFRGTIAPDTGMSLAYLDYSQFEPGILAYLSGDRQLLDAYNEGDMYISLSEHAFGRADKRSLSKRMFLAFCYGMSAEGIAHLMTSDETQRIQYSEAVIRFFSAFPLLKEYRKTTQQRLIESGKTSSPLGNFRARSHSGPLTSKERRWAMNHPVQSTASLIFKEALLKLAERFGNNSILLPVHDAVLMQFPANSSLEATVTEASNLMLEAFRQRCPGIKPRVAVSPFFSS